MKKCVDKDKCGFENDKKRFEEILSEIIDEKTLYNVTELLKALSDPTRLQIMYLLRNNDLCVCEMMSLLEKPQSTLSHHLSILKNARLIKPRKKGVWIYYTLSKPEIWGLLDTFNLKGL